VVADDTGGDFPSASETGIELPVFRVAYNREPLAVGTISKCVTCNDYVVVRVNGDSFRLVRKSREVCEYFTAAGK
jgi:hypothetical protein